MVLSEDMNDLEAKAQAIVRKNYFLGESSRGRSSWDTRDGFTDCMPGALKKFSGVGEKFRNLLIGGIGIMMKNSQFFYISTGGQFYPHNIAGMTPVLTVSN